MWGMNNKLMTSKGSACCPETKGNKIRSCKSCKFQIHLLTQDEYAAKTEEERDTWISRLTLFIRGTSMVHKTVSLHKKPKNQPNQQTTNDKPAPTNTNKHQQLVTYDSLVARPRTSSDGSSSERSLFLLWWSVYCSGTVSMSNLFLRTEQFLSSLVD